MSKYRSSDKSNDTSFDSESNEAIDESDDQDFEQETTTRSPPRSTKNESKKNKNDSQKMIMEQQEEPDSQSCSNSQKSDFDLLCEIAEIYYHLEIETSTRGSCKEEPMSDYLFPKDYVYSC